MTWNGANPNISNGSKYLTAKGPNPNLLSERSYAAVGHNPENCKGAKAGLAKGSIYAQMNAKNTNNIKCN